MAYLWGVTLIWAFSFSLIGVYLSGRVDSYFAVLTRIVLACLIFVPLLAPRRVPARLAGRLMLVGALQIGLMYIFFYQSFLWLTVPEVLLFTIFTPVYITLIEDLIAGRFSPAYLLMAALAVAGAAIIRYHGAPHAFWSGFALVQGANLCFALGQIGYRRVAPAIPAGLSPLRLFGWFFVGALPVAILAFALFGDYSGLARQPVQWAVLAWLGVVASGIGYFLWNQGAIRVSAGKLAIMNNVLIPAGLLVNVLIWNRNADLMRLAAGGAVMLLALMLNTWVDRRGKHAVAA